MPSVEPGDSGLNSPAAEDSGTWGRRALLLAGLSIASALALVVWKNGSRAAPFSTSTGSPLILSPGAAGEPS